MARYIDADALTDYYRMVNRAQETEWQKGFWDGVDNMLAVVDKLPTIDAAPVVHSKWKSCGFSDGGLYQEQCSACGGWSHDIGNYCPNCGARMDGDSK